MKTIGRLLCYSTVTILLFFSCSSDDPDPKVGPNFSISDMAGNWEATEALFIPAVTHKPEDEKYKVRDGGSVSLVIQSSGRFTLTVNLVDQDLYTVSGSIFFEDSEFFAIEFDKYPGDYDYYDARLTTTTL